MCCVCKDVVVHGHPTASPSSSPTQAGCQSAVLDPLAPFVALHSSDSGASASSSAVAYSGPVSTTLSVPLAGPGTSGRLHAYADTYSSEPFGSASFSFASSRATSVAAVLRTPTVYTESDGVHDRHQVIVAVQLRDAEGNSYVSTSGLTTYLDVATSGQSTLSTVCSRHTTSTGLATCTITVPSRWFSTSAGTATATIRVAYSGVSAPVATSNVNSVALAATPTHTALSSSGMTFTLPFSPRFQADEFDCTLTASIIDANYGLSAWTVTLTADSSKLEYISYTKDPRWGDVVPEESDISNVKTVKLLVNSPTNSDPAWSLVNGPGSIAILVARLKVKWDAAGGVYAVGLAINSMINHGNNLFVENGNALVLDHRETGSADGVGKVQVEVPLTRGLFAYAPGGRAVVSNVAPITAESVELGSISVIQVTERPAAATYISTTGGVCMRTSGALSVTRSCAVSLKSDASLPTTGATELGAVRVTEGGLSTSVPFKVWHPGVLTLVVDDVELNKFDGCTNRYEWTRLRLRGNGGNLDLTPLLAPTGDLALTPSGVVSLTFVSSTEGTSRVLVRGEEAGSAEVSLVAQAPVKVAVAVSATTVVVQSLSAHLVTGMSGPTLSASSFGSSSGSFDATFGLEQTLDSEGDSGRVFAFATTSSSNMLWPLPPSELTVASMTSDIVVSQSGSSPWKAEVAAGAGRQCTDVANVTWAVCPGLTVVANVYAFLQLPAPSTVRITTRTFWLAPQASPAPPPLFPFMPRAHTMHHPCRRCRRSSPDLPLPSPLCCPPRRCRPCCHLVSKPMRTRQGDLAALAGISKPTAQTLDVVVVYIDPVTDVRTEARRHCPLTSAMRNRGRQPVPASWVVSARSPPWARVDATFLCRCRSPPPASTRVCSWLSATRVAQQTAARSAPRVMQTAVWTRHRSR